ncbi:MAG: CHAT domain-containing protein [Sphingobium sp.]
MSQNHHMGEILQVWDKCRAFVISRTQAIDAITAPAVVAQASPQSCEELATYLRDLVNVPASDIDTLASLLREHADALRIQNHFTEAFILMNAAEAAFGQIKSPEQAQTCAMLRDMLAMNPGVLKVSRAKISEPENCPNWASSHEEAERSQELDCAAVTPDGIHDDPFPGSEFDDVGTNDKFLWDPHSKEAVAEALVRTAGILRRTGGFEKAIDKFEEAYRRFNRLGQSEAAAGVRLQQASLLLECERFGEALAAATEGKKLFGILSDSYKMAQCGVLRAGALQYIGHYQESLEEYRQAEDTLCSFQDQIVQLRAHRTNVWMALGQYQKAFAELDCLLILASDNQRPYLLGSRGNALLELKRYDEALDDLNRAEAMFIVTRNSLRLAITRLNRSNVYGCVKLWQKQFDDSQAAKPVFRKLGHIQKLALCLMNQASALIGLGRPLQATKTLGLLPDTRLPLNLGVKYAITKARALNSSGFPKKAVRDLEETLERLRSILLTSEVDEADPEFIAQHCEVAHTLGVFALEAGRPDLSFRALQNLKAVILTNGFTDNSIPADDPPYVLDARRRLSDWLRGGSLKARKDSLEQRGIVASTPQSEQSEASADVNAELDATTAVKIHEYWEGWRSFRRSVRSKHPQLLAVDDSLKGVCASLPSDWAILDYWVQDNATVKAYIVTAGGLEVADLTIDEDFWDGWVEVRDWTRSRHATRDDLLDKCYKSLISPLIPRLRGVEGLYLVPHSLMHDFPLHACRDENGDYLCDRFQTAYLPSSAWLGRLPEPALAGSMTSFANPDRGTAQTLPFAEWEALTVGRELALKDHALWIGKEATLDKVRSLGKSSIVHFSCHGQGVWQCSSLSSLMLADDSLFAHDVLYRIPPLARGSLIVLNGCETAARDQRAVDEGIGLMNSFLLRGASATLATQWRVSDCCAAEIVSVFLKRLVTNGDTLSSSLREALWRGRSMSAEDVEGRCSGLLEDRFSIETAPHEAAKVCREAIRACSISGNWTGVGHYAGLARLAYRKVGDEASASIMEQKRDDGVHRARSATRPNNMQLVYDHPIDWSAFQLTGRVH